MKVSLKRLLELPRPEYAKQTEMILVDLLWRSRGSVLGRDGSLQALGRRRPGGDKPSQRLVYRRLRHGKSDAKLVPTASWVEGMGAQGLFSDEGDYSLFCAALMNSVAAPTSRQDKSVTCVPVDIGLVPLQTLHGAVNKDQPPDMAKAVEVMAALGGGSMGAAARLLATSMRHGRSEDLASTFFGLAASEVWRRLEIPEPGDWPSDLATDGEAATEVAGMMMGGTPPGWFWKAWTTLLDPSNGWRAALPDRRFTDWAVCLLRSGLAMTYIWEAEFFIKLRGFLEADTATANETWAAVKDMFDGPRLLHVGRPGLSRSRKDISAGLRSGLGDGYYARSDVEAWLEKRGEDLVLETDAGAAFNRENVRKLARFEPRAHDIRDAPKTMWEFVRYLLQARVLDGAAWDETDLYYLTRSAGKNVWVEPGPEWLVLVASLAAGQAGSTCTLARVAESFRRLGLDIGRTTLVELLEGAGLTQDSPDADEAILVSAGF